MDHIKAAEEELNRTEALLERARAQHFNLVERGVIKEEEIAEVESSGTNKEIDRDIKLLETKSRETDESNIDYLKDADASIDQQDTQKGYKQIR